MLSYDDVARAAMELVAAGQQPSLRLILRRTGGSKTDVARHFRVWREEQAAVGAGAPAVPPELQGLELLSPEIARRVRQALMERAQGEVDAAVAGRKAAESACRELEHELEEAQVDLAAAAARSAAAEHQVAQFHDALHQSGEDIKSLIAQVQAATLLRLADQAEQMRQLVERTDAVAQAVLGIAAAHAERDGVLGTLSRMLQSCLVEQERARNDLLPGIQAALRTHLAAAEAAQAEHDASLVRTLTSSITAAQAAGRRREVRCDLQARKLLAHLPQAVAAQLPPAVRGRERRR